MIDIFITVLSLVTFRITATNPALSEGMRALFPDDMYNVELYVTMRWGLYANLIAQVLSQLISHCAIYYHYKSVSAHADWMSRKEQKAGHKLDKFDGFAVDWNSTNVRLCCRPLSAPSGRQYVPRACVQLGVLLMMLGCCYGVFLGAATPSLRVEINGIAGIALDMVTLQASREEEFSVIGVVLSIVGQEEQSESLLDVVGLYSMGLIFLICTLVVPILQSLTIALMWGARLSISRLKLLVALNEVFSSWQYLEVYLIGMFLLILQIGQVSRFIVNDGCDGLIGFFDLLVRLGLLQPKDAECFYIDATTLDGCTVLLVCAVALNFCNQLVTRCARACIAEETATQPRRRPSVVLPEPSAALDMQAAAAPASASSTACGAPDCPSNPPTRCPQPAI